MTRVDVARRLLDDRHDSVRVVVVYGRPYRVPESDEVAIHGDTIDMSPVPTLVQDATFGADHVTVTPSPALIEAGKDAREIFGRVWLGDPLWIMSDFVTVPPVPLHVMENV
jgi:hypothetical protein